MSAAGHDTAREFSASDISALVDCDQVRGFDENGRYHVVGIVGTAAVLRLHAANRSEVAHTALGHGYGWSDDGLYEMTAEERSAALRELFAWRIARASRPAVHSPAFSA